MYVVIILKAPFRLTHGVEVIDNHIDSTNTIGYYIKKPYSLCVNKPFIIATNNMIDLVANTDRTSYWFFSLIEITYRGIFYFICFRFSLFYC